MNEVYPFDRMSQPFGELIHDGLRKTVDCYGRNNVSR